MEIYFRSVKKRGAFSIFPLRHQSKKYNTDLLKCIPFHQANLIDDVHDV